MKFLLNLLRRIVILAAISAILIYFMTGYYSGDDFGIKKLFGNVILYVILMIVSIISAYYKSKAYKFHFKLLYLILAWAVLYILLIWMNGEHVKNVYLYVKQYQIERRFDVNLIKPKLIMNEEEYLKSQYYLSPDKNYFVYYDQGYLFVKSTHHTVTDKMAVNYKQVRIERVMYYKPALSFTMKSFNFYALSINTQQYIVNKEGKLMIAQ